MVKVDLCTLDNALENSYVSHFMRGKTTNIVYNTFISALQTVVAAETQINVSRSLSKMESVFVTLDTLPLGMFAKRFIINSGILFGLLMQALA